MSTKLHFFVQICSTLCWSILLLQQVGADDEVGVQLLDYRETCQEDLFTLDDDDGMFRKLIKKRRSRRGEALDCFGVGSMFAGALDWFLKQDANGTHALKVTFHAITRNRPERTTIYHGEKFTKDQLDFDIRRRTVLIVHGFLASGDEKWIDDMARALLKWDDVNVFVVDWSEGSNTWNYYKAAVNTKTVGDQIATLFGRLVESANEDSNDVDLWGPIHFIGHSLGAHICGNAAKAMKERGSKWLVQRITGLDPAQPCFKNSDKSLRLTQDDAPFVDIIHTNGRVLSKLGLGLPNPVGHTDFYPNGGKVQPGCIMSESPLWKYLPMPIKKISETICSHGRSYLYFIDSIMSAVKKSCTFWAYEWDLSYNEVDVILETQCTSDKCIEMGINAEKYALNTGTFFAITGRARPFCYIDEDTKGVVKDIIDKVKKNLKCRSRSDLMDLTEANEANETLVVYS